MSMLKVFSPLLLILIMMTLLTGFSSNIPWYYRYEEGEHIILLFPGPDHFNETAFKNRLEDFGLSIEDYRVDIGNFSGIVYRSLYSLSYIVYVGTVVINNTNYTLFQITHLADPYMFVYKYTLNTTISNTTINKIAEESNWTIVSYNERSWELCMTTTPSTSTSTTTSTGWSCSKAIMRSYTLVYVTNNEYPIIAGITVFENSGSGEAVTASNYTYIEVRCRSVSSSINDVVESFFKMIGVSNISINWVKNRSFYDENTIRYVFSDEITYLRNIHALRNINMNTIFTIYSYELPRSINKTIIVGDSSFKVLDYNPFVIHIWELPHNPEALPIDPLHPHVTFTTTSTNIYSTTAQFNTQTSSTSTPLTTTGGKPSYMLTTTSSGAGVGESLWSRTMDLLIAFIVALVVAYILFYYIREKV
jgi:hypothetical protein